MKRLKKAAMKLGKVNAAGDGPEYAGVLAKLETAALEYFERHVDVKQHGFQVHNGFVRLSDGGSIRISLEQKPMISEKSFKGIQYKLHNFKAPEGVLPVGLSVFEKLRAARYNGAITAEVERDGIGIQTKFTVTGYDEKDCVVTLVPPPMDWKWT